MYLSTIKITPRIYNEFKTAIEEGASSLEYLVNAWREDAYEEGFSNGEQNVEENPWDFGNDWIRQGYLDEAVEERAVKMGMSYPPNNSWSDMIQSQHRVTCPDGPYGWEFCSKCNSEKTRTYTT